MLMRKYVKPETWVNRKSINNSMYGIKLTDRLILQDTILIRSIQSLSLHILITLHFSMLKELMLFLRK